MSKHETIDNHFETHVLDYNVTHDTLKRNNYEFLGVAKGKDGYQELHVFRKDKEYSYFKFHPENGTSKEEYEFVIKTGYMAEDIKKS